GKGEIVPGEKLVIAKGANNKYMLAGLNAATEQTNEEKANEIGTTLGEIKIVGVREKPQGLTARLERANSRDAQLLSRYLNPKGFFLAGGGKLVSNEGDLLFETKSGVRYTLRFGELVLGEGDEVTAGIGSDAPKVGDDSKQAANNRYLMVTVAFDEALLKKPAGVRLAAEELAKRSKARAMIQSIQAALATYTTANEGKLPAALADLTVKPEEGEALLKDLSVDPWGNQYDFVPAGDTYVLMSHAADGKSGGDGANQDVRSDQLPLEDALATAATEWTTFDSKVETGREEAESLTKRFGPWYYVIDKALFDKLKPSRADLVEPKAEEPKPGDAPK
ncbi:MAG: general secretion pathway protein G, partial [Planctomycetota bacterium]